MCTNVNGKCEYLKDSDGFYTIILAVNEEEFRTLNNALLTGYLIQAASCKQGEWSMSLSRDIKWTSLLTRFPGILTDVELYMSVYHVDLKQAESAINMMTELKDMAAEEMRTQGTI